MTERPVKARKKPADIEAMGESFDTTMRAMDDLLDRFNLQSQELVNTFVTELHDLRKKAHATLQQAQRRMIADRKTIATERNGRKALLEAVEQSQRIQQQAAELVSQVTEQVAVAARHGEVEEQRSFTDDDDDIGTPTPKKPTDAPRDQKILENLGHEIGAHQRTPLPPEDELPKVITRPRTHEPAKRSLMASASALIASAFPLFPLSLGLEASRKLANVE